MHLIPSVGTFSEKIKMSRYNTMLTSPLSICCLKMAYSVLQLPGAGDLYSYYVDCENRRLENWEKVIPPFTYNPEVKHSAFYLHHCMCG